MALPTKGQLGGSKAAGLSCRDRGRSHPVVCWSLWRLESGPLAQSFPSCGILHPVLMKKCKLVLLAHP